MHFIFQEIESSENWLKTMSAGKRISSVCRAGGREFNSWSTLILKIVPFPEGDVQTTLTLIKCFGSSNRET